MNTKRKMLCLGTCCFAFVASCAFGQAAGSYDALIQQGKAQLQAGHADQALATGEQAIKLDAKNWEGYALAGGALMNLKRYDEAISQFSDAMERAPQDKQAGLSDLRKQCFAAESGNSTPPSTPPTPATSPSTPETTTTQAEAAAAPAASAAQPQLQQANVEAVQANAEPAPPAALNSGSTNSPTLDETMQFILAHSDISQTIDEHDSLSYQETYGVSSPAACTLTWNSLYILSQFAQNRSSFTVRLADVDSNTIVAVDKAVNLGAAQDHADFAVSTVNLQSSHVLSLNYSSKNPSARDARVASGIAAAKTYACGQNEKECTSNQVTNGVSASLWVGDPTTAFRVARALKHAALLCGAKSSTPF